MGEGRRWHLFGACGEKHSDHLFFFFKVTVATKQMCCKVSFCVALYIALTLHYVALKRFSFFCTDVYCRFLSRQTIAEGILSNSHRRRPTRGRRPSRGSFLGVETRHAFGAAEQILSEHCRAFRSKRNVERLQLRVKTCSAKRDGVPGSFCLFFAPPTVRLEAVGHVETCTFLPQQQVSSYRS